MPKNNQATMPLDNINNRRHLFKQFFQYACVGGFAFCVDAGLLMALTETLGLHYLISAAAGFLAGLLTNYLLSVYCVFTFRAVSERGREFLIFAIIGISGLALNQLLLFSLTEGLGFHYLTSKLIAAGIILLFNFGARSWLLFSTHSPFLRRLAP